MNIGARLVGTGVVFSALLVVALPAFGQPLGAFRWQLQPFCNIVTVAVTQNGPIYTLDGTDDQCGATTHASVLGTAFSNPEGTIGFGLNIVGTPGGAPVHVDATISIATLNGTWRDSAGNDGAFVFTPGAGSGGPPRPVTGGLGGVTVTTVTAGTGLTGGGTNGTVNLAVAFGGTGAATTAARSDHTHAAAGTGNTTVGAGALPLISTGGGNTALGNGAMANQTTGANSTGIGAGALAAGSAATNNTGVGVNALFSTTAGTNVAVGSFAMEDNVTGTENVAVGLSALRNGTAVGSNTAIGRDALRNATGSSNTALGHAAGASLTTGSGNLYLEHAGTATESNTTRVGSGQTRAFVAGVRGVVTGVNNAIAVLIDGNGQLGTTSSSHRFKEEIEPLRGGAPWLQQMRPVQFRYLEPFADGSKPIQYGLIAEEVAEVNRELVAYDADGRPGSVKYHVLPALLVAEVQRLEQERLAQRAIVDEHQRRLEQQAAELAALRALVDSMTRQGAPPPPR
jgi:hypothetical protein